MISLLAAVWLGKALLTSFEYRNPSPAALFPFGRTAAEGEVPDESGNPAYLPFFHYGYISSAASNPYSIEGLYQGNISVGYGTGTAGIGGSWSRLGTGFYSEDQVELKWGVKPWRVVSAGMGFTYYTLHISAEDLTFKTSLSDISASLLLIPFPWLNLALRQENIRSLRERERSDLLFPETSGGISVKPAEGVGFSWDLRRTSFGTVNSFSLSATLLSFLKIRGGYSREILSYSAALSLCYNRYSLSYGFRYHAYLGGTHSLGITLLSKAVPYRKINYHTRRERKRRAPEKKIDIRTCNLEDLKGIPCLSETLAVRIIRYRKMIGPVSEKSLIQVGMPADDTRQLKEYIYGLEPEKMRRKKKFRNRKSSGRKRRGWGNLNKRKRIFVQLLETGIGATASLRLSELSISGGSGEVDSYLDSIPGLTGKKKARIKRICAGH